MKKNLFFIAAALIYALIIFQCNNSASPIKDLKIGNRDSVRKVGAFMGYQFRTTHWGDMIRVTYDTVAYVAKPDSSNLKKELTRVTWYSVTVPVQVDSAFAAQFHVPLLDSLGKPNVVRFQMDLMPKYVVDASEHADFDLDSALLYLKKFVVTDSITKK